MLYTMLPIKVISLNNLLVNYLNYSCVNNDKHDLFHYNIHYKVTHTKKQTNKQTSKQKNKQRLQNTPQTMLFMRSRE